MSLNLVLAYESSALAAPQSFRDAMQAAANILDSVITNNITVTIRVGYGDWDNNLDTGITTGAEGGDLNGVIETYASIKAALASHETSAFDQTFVNSLPSTASLNGVSNFYVPSAVAKALGFISPTSSIVDGAVGMGTQIPSNLLVGAALHELTHAMGREPGVGPFDLLRYTSPGNHLFSSGNTAVPAYFSIDGGNTKLADFGQASDPSDFLNSGVQGARDPFDEFYSSSTIQNLTAVDKEFLDVLGFNLAAAPVATVIELNGVTSLTEVANHFYLYDSSGTGPSLKFAGVDSVAGQYGTWAPIGAEKTTTGYEVAWKDASSGLYTVWNTDNNGNYVSNIAAVAGGNATLESLETSFHQDLNGDGVIGPPGTVIESNGAISWTEVANHFYFYDSTGAGPSLKFAGIDSVAGQYGTWAPVGAEKTASGYEVAWKDASSGLYTVWNTDSTGNYVSNIGAVSSSNATLESLEPSFQQDLNGDGAIGVPGTIESNGATSLVETASHFLLDDSTGGGPSLKFSGTACMAGQYGGWAPIGAEKTTTGYEVAWKDASSGLYTVWNTDSNGNYVSNIGAVSGSNATLVSLEPSFQQDLNGDGVVGAPAAVAAVTADGDARNLIGGPNGVLNGGAGADTFIFPEKFGLNTVSNFTLGTDVLQFSQSSFASAADVLRDAQQVGSNVVITYDTQDVVTLQNLQLSSLHASDIHIV